MSPGGFSTRRKKHQAGSENAKRRRSQQLAVLYQTLGSLKAAGKKVGLTKERVRQILAEASQQGWIGKVEPRLSPWQRAVARIRQAVSEQGLQGLLAPHPQAASIKALSKALGVSANRWKEAFGDPAIVQAVQDTLKARRGARARLLAVARYKALVDRYGRHLSSAEVQREAPGLLVRICELWGGYIAFRRAHGILPPTPHSRIARRRSTARESGCPLIADSP